MMRVSSSICAADVGQIVSNPAVSTSQHDVVSEASSTLAPPPLIDAVAAAAAAAVAASAGSRLSRKSKMSLDASGTAGCLSDCMGESAGMCLGARYALV